MRPKFASPSVRFGLAKAGELVRLVASARNSSFARSVRSNFRKSDRSRLPRPGPEKLLRPAVPKRVGTEPANGGFWRKQLEVTGMQPVVSIHVALPAVPAIAWLIFT